jgi:hypothetical protein
VARLPSYFIRSYQSLTEEDFRHFTVRLTKPRFVSYNIRPVSHPVESYNRSDVFYYPTFLFHYRVAPLFSKTGRRTGLKFPPYDQSSKGKNHSQGYDPKNSSSRRL